MKLLPLKALFIFTYQQTYISACPPILFIKISLVILVRDLLAFYSNTYSELAITDEDFPPSKWLIRFYNCMDE